MKATIERSVEVQKTPRVLQMSGMFDVPQVERSTMTWSVDLPIDGDDWHVGLIVGPSGAGKSTIARELFGDAVMTSFEWPADRSVLDGFPDGMSIKEITSLLNAVGFSTAPHWLRPFCVLSNGEQFRATVARALAEADALVVIDEFTSVVDRTVAKIASHTVQKAIRRSKRKFIAVSCHYDVLEWLQPDWVYEPHVGTFERRRLRRRPEIAIEIRRTSKDLWPIFSRYHYLSPKLIPAAQCYAMFLEDRPIAFNAVWRYPHPKARDIIMGHRLVVLPDYQGLGLGGFFDDWLGEFYFQQGYRYRNVIAHPAMAYHYARSKRWRLDRSGMGSAKHGKSAWAPMKRHWERKTGQRATSSFEYQPYRARDGSMPPADFISHC